MAAGRCLLRKSPMIPRGWAEERRRRLGGLPSGSMVASESGINVEVSKREAEQIGFRPFPRELRIHWAFHLRDATALAGLHRLLEHMGATSVMQGDLDGAARCSLRRFTFLPANYYDGIFS